MAQTVDIVSRKGWGAVSPKHDATKISLAHRVVIHHTANPSCKNQKEYFARLLSIQRVHMSERNFDDIGYNFLVGGDGTVYEGRGWGVKGAHAKDNNDDSLGIAFMGHFENGMPSSEAMSAVKQLLQLGVSGGFLNPEFTVIGHRDLGDTSCPGEKLHAELHQLRGAPAK